MSWLWKKDTSSPASFEKALSKLSAQIQTASVTVDNSRSRSRRISALWTLYTTLTYLLYTLVLALVLGPQRWALPHYAGLLGAPVVIYSVRRATTTLFEWRIARQQTYLTTLQKQREAKINDLKKATKYDSTQELLQKYGGAPRYTPTKPAQQGIKRKINPPPGPTRTGIAPPPTANIPGRNVSSPSTPQRTHAASPSSSTHSLTTYDPSAVSPDGPGFAPNAFSSVTRIPQPAYEHKSHWYDRILDVMLGEDETLAKNRLALICTSCRLVNGQAQPGVKSLAEVGRWRCSSCSAWNGSESEAAKVVKEMLEHKDVDDGWEKTSTGVAKPDEPSGHVPDVQPSLEAEASVEDLKVTSEEDSEGESATAALDEAPSKRVTRSANKQKA